MSKASLIVDALLEADDPQDANINPESYLHQYADQIDRDKAEGKLTPQTALTAQYFYHRTQTYKDGVTPIQVRRNGATKTWKTRPDEFKIPVKYGMYEFFYITDKNASEWSTQPLPSKPKPEKKKARVPISPSSLMPPLQ